MVKKLFNLSLNLINFSIKGLFFIIGAKYLHIEDLGKLGIFFSYISIFVFLLGFEYWYFSNRKISIAFHKNKKEVLKIYIYNQFYFSFIWFLAILIPIYMVMHNSFSNINFLVVVISIYSFYIIQEISRFLMHIGKQILSSLSILSLSLWTLPIYFMWFYLGKTIPYTNIIYVYGFTLFLFAILWLFLFFYKINLNIIDIIKINRYFNIYLQKKVIKLSSIMLLSVISYKVSELSPRIFLDLVKDYKLAGIITFYQSFAMLSIGIVYYFISVFFIPSLLKKKNNILEFKETAYRFKKNLIYTSVFFFLVSNVIPFVFIKLFNIHHEYLEYYHIFLALNLSYIFINISTYYLHIAYTRGIDKVIYITNFISFLGVLISYIFFKILNFSNIYIIISSFIIFALLQFLLKRNLLKKYWRENI